MKKKPLLIAFCAPKQTGKTTTARAISAGRAAKILSFASPLKDFAAMIFSEEYMNEKKELPDPRTGMSYRDFAVHTGDVWRGLNRNVFIDILNASREDLNVRYCGLDAVVIDDLRYANEAQYVKDQGGIIIQLNRGGVQYKMDHATERPIDPNFVDYFCSVNDAEALVEQLIEEFRVVEEQS